MKIINKYTKEEFSELLGSDSSCFKDFKFYKEKVSKHTNKKGYKSRNLRTYDIMTYKYIKKNSWHKDKAKSKKEFDMLLNQSKNAYKIKKEHQGLNIKLNKALKKLGDEYAYGFNGKQLYESAEAHMYNYHFYNFDFLNFFNSLQIEDLARMYSFSDLNITEDEFELLIKGNDNGELAQGLVVSPVISNLILLDFDKYMQEQVEILYKKYCKYLTSQKPVYTRYADDITISFPENLIYSGINDKNRDAKRKRFLAKIQTELKFIIISYINNEINNKRIYNTNAGKNLRLNNTKTRHSSFLFTNHYKLLSWNIIKGKPGKDNYITAGRKATRRGLYGYQEYGIKNSENIKNQTKVVF